MDNNTRDVYKDYEPAGKESGVFPLPEGKCVLEIGIGSGKLMEALRDKGNIVYGIDVSESIIDSARAKGFENTVLMDISEEPLPFPENFFDTVFCYEVFEHLANPYRLFTEVRRTLKPLETLYFSVPAQEIDMGYGLGRHPFVYPGLLEKANLERFFMQMYFRILQFSEPGPHDHLQGRNYALINMKHLNKPDIMKVVITANNVIDLYSDIVEPDRLLHEIEREVNAFLLLLEESIEKDDLDQILCVVRYLIQEYPGYYSMYPQIAGMLKETGKLAAISVVLKTVMNMEEMPPEIHSQLNEILESDLKPG